MNISILRDNNLNWVTIDKLDKSNIEAASKGHWYDSKRTVIAHRKEGDTNEYATEQLNRVQRVVEFVIININFITLGCLFSKDRNFKMLKSGSVKEMLITFKNDNLAAIPACDLDKKTLSDILENSESQSESLPSDAIDCKTKISDRFIISPKVSNYCSKVIKSIVKVALQIFQILRSILYAPFIALDMRINGSSIRFFNLRLSKNTINPAVPAGDVSLEETERSLMHSSKSSSETAAVDLSNGKKKTVVAKQLCAVVDPTDSYKWKKELISNAEHSLEISGYCGGKPFLEFLNIIQEKLKNETKFIVRIICNVNTLNEEDKEKLKQLQKEYPIQFECIQATAVWGVFPEIMRHENHTKMVIADKKYFISGGTGITNRLLGQGKVKEAGGNCAFLSDGNRDIDLLGEGEIAEVMKEQFDEIWHKWKQVKNLDKKPDIDQGSQSTKTSMQIDLGESDKDQLCELVFSHPEQGKKNMGQEIYIKLIDEAKESITVSNMVFNHNEIIKVLADAVRKGINVKVVTNGYSKSNSFAGNSLGPRNRVHYGKLFKAAKQEKAGSVSIYEFSEPDILLHSKVMLVDEETDEPKVVVGSFNLSRESANCDDEQMIVTTSKQIAVKITECIDSFIDNSNEIEQVYTDTIPFKINKGFGKMANLTLCNVVN